MKRLTLSGKVKAVSRGRDECNVYLDVDNGRLSNHSLKIVDCYYAFKFPSLFDVERKFGSYEPDVYAKDRNGNLICIEVQLTRISGKRMQEKANNFYKEFSKHGAKVFYLVSDHEYDVKLPNGFHVVKFRIPKEFRIGVV